VRVPVKSEADAFYLAIGGAILLLVCVVLGAVVAPLVGVAVLAGVVLGAIGWEFLTKDPAAPQPLSDALAAGRRGAKPKRRVLVIANETVGGRELRDEILRRGSADVELRVVAPVLPSRAHYVASDIDGELAEARKRLGATLSWAAEHGFEATGRVGDMTPLVAIEDELRSGGADEVIISTHVARRSRWLESGLVERAREELDIPVTHVVVDLANQQVQIGS